MQLPALEVLAVYIGNFIFPARRWLQITGNLHDFGVVKIKPRDRPVALGFCRFFFNAESLQFLVEFDYAIPFGIFDLVGKHARTRRQLGGIFKHARQIRAIENVITEDQTDRRILNEICPEHKCLSDAVGLRLFDIFKLQANL